jgi:type IV secretion system protein VirB1
VILTLSVLLGLAQQCAPAVAPETLLSVARAESGFDPLVVAVNGAPRRVYHPASAAQAAGLAAGLIAAGQSVDLGLGQINSRNLARLELSLRDAFDPCRNLAASAQILREGYVRAAPAPGAEQRGLKTAFSLYNTGDPARGLANGYVAKVTHAAAIVVPALRVTGAEQPLTAKPPPAAAWDVFASAPADGVNVF